MQFPKHTKLQIAFPIKRSARGVSKEREREKKNNIVVVNIKEPSTEKGSCHASFLKSKLIV